MIAFLLAILLQTSTQATSDEFTKAFFFGKKFAEMKDYPSAVEQFKKADTLQPDNPAVLYDLAVVLAKAGRYSEAQTKTDRYMQLFPTGNERPQIQKLQLELGFQAELQKKRQADESYAELFNRGKFLYGKGDLDASLKAFQDAEAQRPNDAAAVFNQALIYETQGDLQKAAERYRRYSDVEADTDAKGAATQRLIAVDSELEDMKTKMLCPFCGLKLPSGAMWCPRCWHGPYAIASAIWNSRPCVPGATATRATYYADGRFARNDSLPCLFDGAMLEALRYSPAKQRAIQNARKAEGWTYNGDVIQRLGDKVVFVQGSDYLEKITSPSSGEILDFSAHAAAEEKWLLDREDVVIEGQKYTSHYTYDANNRITRQQVDFQNAAACNHLISETADYAYNGEQLATVKYQGGYDGFPAEGAPHVEWDAAAAYTYDEGGKLKGEDLSVSSFNKTYTQKPAGEWRDEVSKLYVDWRVKRPIESLARRGDLCETNGTLVTGNPIDLRPFYATSPNLAMQIPFGVVRASVTFTYPAKQ
ncbi:MAG TPA: tetratricopeptide repeat protein [Thermoanaerobaculia bacterium]|nr:tetratricopeptide repeat protein [Thermoanaerobaculia bacterium]